MTEQVDYKQTVMADSREEAAASNRRQDTFDFFFLLGLLREKLWTIVGFALAGLAIMVGVGMILRPYYTATATFIPPGANSAGSAALSGQIAQLAGAGGLLGAVKSPGDLYVGVLRSRSIQADMVKRFGLIQRYGVTKESQAEIVLTRATQASVGAKDSIVAISVTDMDPKRAAEMANAYLEELQVTTARLSLTESSQRRAFYENRLAQERDALTQAEAALKNGQERTGLIAPAGQTAAEISALAQLRQEIASREVTLASLLGHETSQNPDVQRIQSELQSLRGQVNQMERGQQGPSGGLSAAQVPSLSLEYSRLAREVKYHETLFDIIAKQYEGARIDEAQDAPLQVLDRATAPDAKAGPKRLTMWAAGFFGGLFGSAAWIILSSRWREMIARRRAAGLPV